MPYYTDIHCHTLFGVDDGAQSFEETQKMLDVAYADGIRRICFTPHFKPFDFVNEGAIEKKRNSISQSFEICVSYAKEKYPDLILNLGNEIMFHGSILDSLESSFCKSLNDSKYVLVEFIPSVAFSEIKNTVLTLGSCGYRAVIAHVERYSVLVKKPSYVTELKKLGALIQINASSVIYFKFGKVASFIKKLFRNSLVDAIASDAHDTSNNQQILSLAYKKTEKKYGEQVANRVCRKIPDMILDNVLI